MSKALVIHLSDIHVRNNENPALRKAPQIASALQDLEADLDAIVIAISGDLAFSGTEEQYILVWEFLDALTLELRQRLSANSLGSTVPISIVAIPGNHDLKFDPQDDKREGMIKDFGKDTHPSLSDQVIEDCTSVQSAFFQLLTAVQRPGSSAIGRGHPRLAYQYAIEVADHKLVVLCFNSAWLSKIHEVQGSLVLPPMVVPDQRPEGDIIVSLLHHPWSWYEPVSRRKVQARIEAVSDLVLTGHEHTATIRTQQVSTGERNTYIEGGALFDSEDTNQSAFNAIVLDLGLRKQKILKFEWSRDRYIAFGLLDSLGEELHATWEELQSTRLRVGSRFEMSNATKSYLNDMGSPVLHRVKGSLQLDDLFIYPTLQEINYPDMSAGRRFKSKEVIDLINDSQRLLIIGDSQSGKTTLAKRVFKQLHDAGYVPLLLTGAHRPPGRSALVDYLLRLFEGQYSREHREAYRQLDHSLRVVIIDDYHKLTLKPDQKAQFLEGVLKFADRVVIFGYGLVQDAHDLFEPLTRTENVAPFAKLRILPFGPLLRNDLIEKWLSLDESIVDSTSFAYRRDELVRTFNSMTSSSRLPSNPLVIVTALASTEAVIPFNSDIGRQGVIYDVLIRSVLANGKDSAEYGLSQNYLAHIAYNLFVRRSRVLSYSEYCELHRGFENTYELSLSVESMLKELVDLRLLTRSGDAIRFKHKYIYYYSVASWMKDHIHNEPIRDDIRRLSRSIHVEENANILLFLAHLSKEPIILDEIMTSAKGLHLGRDLATFDDDVSFIIAMKDTGTRTTYVEGDSEKRRRDRLKADDEDNLEIVVDSEYLDDNMLPLDVDGYEELGFVGELVAATKTLEVLGQFLKNFPGTMDAETKLVVANQCYGLGLRMMSAFYDAVRENREEWLALIAENLQKKKTTGSPR